MVGKLKTLNRKLIYFFVVVTASLVLVILPYSHFLNDSMSKYACRTLEEITLQQTASFTSSVKQHRVAINTIARFFAETLSNQPTMSSGEILHLLEETQTDSGFTSLVYIDVPGQIIATAPGTQVSASDSFVRQTLAGESQIFGPVPSLAEGQGDQIYFTAPLRVNGRVIAAISGAASVQELGSQITSAFSGEGIAYICDKHGNIVAIAGSLSPAYMEDLNVLHILQQAKYLSYDDYQTITDNMAAGKSGHTIYQLKEDKLRMHYQPIAVNDWYMLSVVSDDIISSERRAISLFTGILVVGTMLVLSAIFVMVVRNDRKYAQELYQAAYYDERTHLPNLAKFKLDVREMLKAHADQTFMVAKLDIAQFKMINEMYGFDVGDRIIMAVASVLAELQAVPFTLAARINADEFVWITPCHDSESAPAFHTSFEAKISTQLKFLGNHKVRFIYGQYFLDLGESDIDSIMEKVNLAHHIAKTQKNSTICAYDESFKKRVIAEIELTNKMEEALRNQEFIVYLQPKYRLDTEEIAGAEALVRWVKDSRSISYPNEFIPLFEKNGFVTKLDMYMLGKVCQIIKGWRESGQALVPVSINFSRLHLMNDHFVEELDEIVTSYGIPKKYIEIELTETTIFDNEEVLHTILHRLHAAGFTLSMDDFGTGYSSLGLLKNLPVDVIKIDRTFFTNNRYKTRARAVIESVIAMARALGIETVAEGVETQEHIDLLREVGCGLVQGYYYSRPMLASEFQVGKRFVPAVETQQYQLLRYEEIGSITEGRPLLGTTMPVEVYRLFTGSLQRVLKKRYGDGEGAEVLVETGFMAGMAFSQMHLDLTLSLNDFMTQLAQRLAQFKICLLIIDSHDEATGHILITVTNDLDCSGMQPDGSTHCQYSEGLIAGMLYEYTHQLYAVSELECWGTGFSYCRFEIKRKS